MSINQDNKRGQRVSDIIESAFLLHKKIYGNGRFGSDIFEINSENEFKYNNDQYLIQGGFVRILDRDGRWKVLSENGPRFFAIEMMSRDILKYAVKLKETHDKHRNQEQRRNQEQYRNQERQYKKPAPNYSPPKAPQPKMATKQHSALPESPLEKALKANDAVGVNLILGSSGNGVGEINHKILKAIQEKYKKSPIEAGEAENLMAIIYKQAAGVDLARDSRGLFDKNDFKKAYRKLALLFHPDKKPDPVSVGIFQMFSAANGVINDSGDENIDISLAFKLQPYEQVTPKLIMIAIDNNRSDFLELMVAAAKRDKTHIPYENLFLSLNHDRAPEIYKILSKEFRPVDLFNNALANNKVAIFQNKAAEALFNGLTIEEKFEIFANYKKTPPIEGVDLFFRQKFSADNVYFKEAIKRNNVAVVGLVIGAGEDKKRLGILLFDALQYSDSQALVSHIISKNPDFNVLNEKKQNPLMAAIVGNDANRVRLVAEASADIYFDKYNDGNGLFVSGKKVTALAYAVAMNAAESFKEIATIDGNLESINSALFFAAKTKDESSRTSFIKTLFAKGANLTNEIRAASVDPEKLELMWQEELSRRSVQDHLGEVGLFDSSSKVKTPTAQVATKAQDDSGRVEVRSPEVTGSKLSSRTSPAIPRVFVDFSGDGNDSDASSQGFGSDVEYLGYKAPALNARKPNLQILQELVGVLNRVNQKELERFGINNLSIEAGKIKFTLHENDDFPKGRRFEIASFSDDKIAIKAQGKRTGLMLNLNLEKSNTIANDLNFLLKEIIVNSPPPIGNSPASPKANSLVYRNISSVAVAA